MRDTLQGPPITSLVPALGGRKCQPGLSTTASPSTFRMNHQSHFLSKRSLQLPGENCKGASFLFVCLFLYFFGCVGSQPGHAGFSLVVAHALQGVWALQLWHMGSRACGLCSLRHIGSLVEARELSSCGTWAQLPRGMWDLSSPTRDGTRIPCIGRWILYHWTTREVPRNQF